MSNEDEWVKP